MSGTDSGSWTCPACGESDAELRQGRARFCVDCQRARSLWRTTRGNLLSGFNRSGKGSPALEINIDAFCAWRKNQVQECHYCGIAEEELGEAGLRSQIQRVLKTMGVDRLDSAKAYETGNLVPCCFVCNQIKGDRFSAGEMRLVGVAVGEVWRQRLAAA